MKPTVMNGRFTMSASIDAGSNHWSNHSQVVKCSAA